MYNSISRNTMYMCDWLKMKQPPNRRDREREKTEHHGTTSDRQTLASLTEGRDQNAAWVGLFFLGTHSSQPIPANQRISQQPTMPSAPERFPLLLPYSYILPLSLLLSPYLYYVCSVCVSLWLKATRICSTTHTGPTHLSWPLQPPSAMCGVVRLSTI